MQYVTEVYKDGKNSFSFLPVPAPHFSMLQQPLHSFLRHQRQCSLNFIYTKQNTHIVAFMLFLTHTHTPFAELSTVEINIYTHNL